MDSVFADFFVYKNPVLICEFKQNRLELMIVFYPLD